MVPEESYAELAGELDEIEAMLDGKLDSSLGEAIQKDIDLQNY